MVTLKRFLVAGPLAAACAVLVVLLQDQSAYGQCLVSPMIRAPMPLYPHVAGTPKNFNLAVYGAAFRGPAFRGPEFRAGGLLGPRILPRGPLVVRRPTTWTPYTPYGP